MKKLQYFILTFFITGGLIFIIAYLKQLGITNPLYVDWNSHYDIILQAVGIGAIIGWGIASGEKT